MIIGIDYRFAISSVRGIGNYIRQVVAQLMVLDTVNTYYLYVNTDTDMDLPSNFKIQKINCNNLVKFEQYDLPVQAKIDELDVLWCPSNSGPLFLNKSIKLVVTVHDLAFIKEWKPAFNIFLSFKKIRFAMAELYRSLALRFGLKRINRIITVSDYSEKEIQRRLSRNARVIPNQANLLLKEIDNNNLLGELGVQPNGYIYTVTGEAPHKGLDNYIRLFTDHIIERPLVISGVFNQQLIKKYGSKHIIFSGYLTESEKSFLYANAYCFLFLSLKEGFGLPLLEAMQYKLPIICANRGALPEIGGDAVLLVEPNDYSSIQMLLNNLEVHLPGNLHVIRQQQLSKYAHWESSALAHLKLFEQEGEF